MKLWLISQDVNTDYDTYDSAVVVAQNEDAARRIHAGGNRIWRDDYWRYPDGSKAEEFGSGTWALPSAVSATLIGEAAENLEDGQVICASFNAE
jgi:hypothetical protein